MSVSSRSGSLKGEDVLQTVQDLLDDKKYPPEHRHSLSSPVVITAGTPYSQSLKDLIINSVSMETTGDTMISSLTGQQGSAVDYVMGFKSLVHFLTHEATPQKTELKQTILYPLFLCCYISLVAMEESEKALSLYSSLEDLINKICTNSHDIKELLLLNNKESLESSQLAEKFRKHKYISRISDPAFKLLFSFLQTHPTPSLINLIEKYFSLEVFGNSVPNNDHKQENKKGLSFVKPRIHPISEIDICLPYSKPKPHPIPPPPPVDMESLAIKADYQQQLVLASQKLDPAPPSLLLCNITTPTNHTIHTATLSQKSKIYAYSLNDSSIMCDSWLPMATKGHVTPKSESCDSLRGHNGPVYGLSFNRTGEYLLSASEDTTVRLWNTKSSQCMVSYEGHQYPVWDVSFSSIDGYFVSSSHDTTARLWNTEYVYPLRIFAGHEDSVEVARFHPNGNYVATGSLDHTLRLWDINSGSSVRLFTGSKQPIVTLAYSPFGKQLASGGSDGTIMLWDISSTKCVMEFKGHTSKITSLAYSSDGTILASCGFDKIIRLWNIKATVSHQQQIAVGVSSHEHQDLIISTHSTGQVIPLTTSFIQRNCLVAVGSNSIYTNNSNHYSENSIETSTKLMANNGFYQI